MKNLARVCIIPYLAGIGGMVSFQRRLAAGMIARGVEITYALDDPPYQAVLVVGGSRQIAGLWSARRKGIPVIQRLDGMNWIHRVRKTGSRHYLRAEYGNLLLTLIRNRLATHIIYQSRFSRSWWEQKRGPARAPGSVIYNGVDLQTYSPEGPGEPPQDHVRILLVEGSMLGGYEFGLEIALGLGEALEKHRTAHSLSEGKQAPIELMIVGRADRDIQAYWEKHSSLAQRWMGAVHPESIPQIDRSAHMLFSADINPACPNAVIEALACGTPVVSFATGALEEIVEGDAGRLAPYGADPWKLERPDIPTLAEKALEILADPERFRQAARARAEAAFDMEWMVDCYLDVLRG